MQESENKFIKLNIRKIVSWMTEVLGSKLIDQYNILHLDYLFPFISA